MNDLFAARKPKLFDYSVNRFSTARKAQKQLLMLMLPFMVISGCFKSHDKFMGLMRKILLQAFRKCIFHEVLKMSKREK